MARDLLLRVRPAEKSQVFCEGGERRKVEVTDAQVATMQAALDKWGISAQAGQTVEECAELIVALQKQFNRSPSPETIDGILDEMADVELMLAQMRLAFDVGDEAFRQRIEDKFEKLRHLL
jgi:N-acetyl-anhydromuramyl-L-alanine amidase AmpD